jgi:hypothetical protein
MPTLIASAIRMVLGLSSELLIRPCVKERAGQLLGRVLARSGIARGEPRENLELDICSPAVLKLSNVPLSAYTRHADPDGLLSRQNLQPRRMDADTKLLNSRASATATARLPGKYPANQLLSDTGTLNSQL